jgi:AbrB family looped-hinge helix DNA binding protein
MPVEFVRMGRNGRLSLPAKVRREIGMPEGGSLMVRVEDGEVRLEPMAHAIARVQALVRGYVPEGTSLTAELSAERRLAAEQE